MKTFKLILAILVGLILFTGVTLLAIGLSNDMFKDASKNHRVSSDLSWDCGMDIGDLIVDKLSQDTLIVESYNRRMGEPYGVFARNKDFKRVKLPCQTFEPLENENQRDR